MDAESRRFVDGQIAAIAHLNGLVLVTNNVTDYEGFEGLTIEDWRFRLASDCRRQDSFRSLGI